MNAGNLCSRNNSFGAYLDADVEHCLASDVTQVGVTLDQETKLSPDPEMTAWTMDRLGGGSRTLSMLAGIVWE